MCATHDQFQWRIQDFADGGGGGRANFQGGGANLLFYPIFPQNLMKMKEIGPGWGGEGAHEFSTQLTAEFIFIFLLPCDMYANMDSW